MAKNKLYFLFLIIGVTAGVSFGLIKARASLPEGETSGGEQPASVYYDETWSATDAVVSTSNGYKSFNPSAHSPTQIAAKFDSGKISLFPKFVVKEWTVHGHIHFQ
jgi:hypothetical protein